MSAVIGGEYKHGFAVTREEKERNAQQSRLTIVLAGVMVLAILLALWFITRAIMRPVEKIVADLSAGAKTVRYSSGELSSASEEMAASSNESAASLEETVASLEEITATISLSSKRAQEASAVAETSAAVAKEGEQSISDLIARMQEIAASSRRIEEIISLIDDIAFQTNLLALNAAVEAARAGEQGRGFAVVAEAVRTLAQRSGEAAKDINQLIRDSVQKITLGSKTADQSGASLHRIVESVEQVSGLVREIAAGNREQAEGVSQISKAMNQLDQATQQNAATSERVSSSAREMSEQADAQQATVDELRRLLLGSADHSPTSEAQMP
jgi:methyl-accepting chemotaxis protein